MKIVRYNCIGALYDDACSDSRISIGSYLHPWPWNLS